jgi:hypothetical protein
MNPDTYLRDIWARDVSWPATAILFGIQPTFANWKRYLGHLHRESLEQWIAACEGRAVTR